ncbi:hypothetical protein AB0E08_37525 [Streptomyces sp. NPDC048281]|uniref:hypothetical protein n=1 Tax=Streptomyces sp. NPDC048281 TaxID=3154715 RepID=UPI00342533A8
MLFDHTLTFKHRGKMIRNRRMSSFAAAGITAVATAMALATPAHAAGVSIKLSCTDPHNTYLAKATLYGSGAPTAKYDVTLSVFDKIDDTRAPMIHLKSSNKDGTVTNYPWRTGDQGDNIQSYWETTLQQPKGLVLIFIEAKTNSSDWAYFQCSDYAPKS